MPLPGSSPSKPGSWPMSVGAAGIAAAQLARCGFDVLIQTGHDKPWYDLAVTKAGNLLKIAVKASDNGCWCLVQSYLKRSGHASGSQADGNRAIDLWLDIHGARIAYCLVQFEGVSLDQMPRIYMATPAEIAQEMRAASARLGDPVLREQYEWRTAETGSLSAEALPSNWRFSPQRIEELVFPSSGAAIAMPAVRRSFATMELRPQPVETTREPMREAILSA